MNHSSDKDLVKQLEDLSQLDIDAIHAYTAAIDRIDISGVPGEAPANVSSVSGVKAQLIAFRADHERHVSDLAPWIERLGGTPPKRTPDFKGFVLQGFTAVRSMISNESALKAMKSNEELTNRTYEQALKMDFSSDVRAVIQRNCDDERRHLEYINRCIADRVWEGPGSQVA